MSDSKHPFFTVIAMSAAVGAGVWVAAEKIRIMPLEADISLLKVQLSAARDSVRSSPEYRELEAASIEVKAICKAENNMLSTRLEEYRNLINERNISISNLTRSSDILSKIDVLQKKQEEANNRLRNVLNSFQPRDSSIVLLQNEINRLQEQIKLLSNSLVSDI